MTVTMMPAGADIFATTCEAIVIPTNCRGVNGAGLAKAAKQRWPTWDRAYRIWCRENVMDPGDVHVSVTGRGDAKREPMDIILAVATKDLWTMPSRVEWVKRGLGEIENRVALHGIASIAIPALGAGLGGLPWDDVRPLIMATEERLSARGVRVEVYPPHEDRKRARSKP